jgi:hypothetical protein
MVQGARFEVRETVSRPVKEINQRQPEQIAKDQGPWTSDRGWLLWDVVAGEHQSNRSK